MNTKAKPLIPALDLEKMNTKAKPFVPTLALEKMNTKAKPFVPTLALEKMNTKAKPLIPTLALEKRLDDQMDSPKIRSPLKSQQSPFFINLDGQLNRINNLNIKTKPFSTTITDDQVCHGINLDKKGHHEHILDTMGKQVIHHSINFDDKMAYHNTPDEKLHHHNIQDDKTKNLHISTGQENCLSVSPSCLDYNLEAALLWDRLGINPEVDSGGDYSILDAVYRSPQGGAIWVGGERAARDRRLLRERGIVAVVNCTRDIPNYHAKEIKYFNFDVAAWKRQCGLKDEVKIANFLNQVLEFINKVISSGGSVLIHCLAGAHRAGTTAIICLMHFGGLSAKQAEETARRLRPIIEPIGDFKWLLRLTDRLPRTQDRRIICRI